MSSGLTHVPFFNEVNYVYKIRMLFIGIHIMYGGICTCVCLA